MSDSFWPSLFASAVAVMLAFMAFRRTEIALMKANGATKAVNEQLERMLQHQAASGVDHIYLATEIRNVKEEIAILSKRLERLENLGEGRKGDPFGFAPKLKA